MWFVGVFGRLMLDVMGVLWGRGCNDAGVPWMADNAQLLLLIWFLVFWLVFEGSKC